MQARTLRRGVSVLGLALASLAYTAAPAAADTLTVMWDPNADPVAGYAVYVGTQSGSLTQRYDVGNTTSFVLGSAVAGQQYCFAVAAYSSSTTEGPKSSEVCGFSNQFPSLTNPGSQASIVGQPVSLQLSGSDPDGQPITYSATGLPAGLSLMSTTGFISGSATTAGTYSVKASVSDGSLTSALQSFSWVVSAVSADTTAPTISISSPTTSSSYSTTTSSMALGGSAADSVGVTSVSWANDRGGNGTATGTTSWNVPSIGLQSGTNTITVTARDAAGNSGTDVLTVTYTPPDTTAPSISIASPTSASTYATTSSSMALGGSASDNVGVTKVTWVSDRGGSGTASGTASWTVPALTLQSGTNIITVTAQDGAGNKGTDVLTVTYTPPDTTAPAITILGPTSASSYSTTSSVVTLGGTASDDTGVTAVTWANDRGGTGFSSGTTSWSVPTVNLQGGTNVITVTAQDAAGNKGTDVLTVTYTAPDTTAPAVTITGPTSSASYSTTTSALALGGTASDDTGVVSIAWSNDRGGSGAASGTTSWSVPSVTLQGGTNVITITAQDAAGNKGTDVLTVTYTAPDTTAPTVSITGPTSASSYSTTSSTLALGGAASDDKGVVSITWSNDRGGSGMASGTSSWSVPSVTLQGGTNVITITAQDAAGNKGTDVLTVTYTAPDTTAPTVTITGPTSASSYSTATSTLALGGTASDDKGVVSIAWSNDRGGSGAASGTSSWSVPSVTLQGGTNVITITAQDAAGNKGTGVLTVDYSAPAGTAPAPAIDLQANEFSSGRWLKVQLTWSYIDAKYLDVYRNNEKVSRTSNNGTYTDSPHGSGPYTYFVCVMGTNVCSNTATVP